LTPTDCEEAPENGLRQEPFFTYQTFRSFKFRNFEKNVGEIDSRMKNNYTLSIHTCFHKYSQIMKYNQNLVQLKVY